MNKSNIFAALANDDNLDNLDDNKESFEVNLNTTEKKNQVILEVQNEQSEYCDKLKDKDNKEKHDEFCGTFARHRNYENRDRTRYGDKMLDNKKIYNQDAPNNDIGNDMKLNTYWTVWIHKNSNTNWTLSGYQKVYQINSIGSFWRFFNNFQYFNAMDNQLFIMREEIAPIWEDVNNKFGGICSMKINSTQKGMKTDISTEIFSIITLLIMNETFVLDNKNINGISFSMKKRHVLIKMWTKTFEENKFIKELPALLMSTFNNEILKQLKSSEFKTYNQPDDYKITVQYKQIKPEYEI
jgi:hypothetical protein